MAFRLDESHNHFAVPNLKYEDGIAHHVMCEGARFHSPSWDTNGEHCSEKNCEVNHGGIREYVECPPEFGEQP